MEQVRIHVDRETSKLSWIIEGTVDDAFRMKQCFMALKRGDKTVYADQHLFAMIDRLLTRLKQAGVDIDMPYTPQTEKDAAK